MGVLPLVTDLSKPSSPGGKGALRFCDPEEALREACAAEIADFK